MMLKKYQITNRSGFTLVEILIASGIFSVFCVGLFSFYRMGSGMFLKGSWKLRKQKECERFLTRLKERIEQTSHAVFINPTQPGGSQIIKTEANFVTLVSGTEIGTGNPGSTEPTGLTRLMLFSVCKPDLSMLPGQASMKGLKLLNSLAIAPSNTMSGAKKLYTLYFGSNTVSAPLQGIDLFNSATTFDPGVPAGGDFSSTPSDYSLGSNESLSKLTDVSYVIIDWKLSTGGNAAAETAKIVGLRIGMQHPKYPETKVHQRMQAKLDFAIPLEAVGIGGI